MLEGQGLYLLKLVPRIPLQATHYSESTCAETVSERWGGLQSHPPLPRYCFHPHQCLVWTLLNPGRSVGMEFPPAFP